MLHGGPPRPPLFPSQQLGCKRPEKSQTGPSKTRRHRQKGTLPHRTDAREDVVAIYRRRWGAPRSASRSLASPPETSTLKRSLRKRITSPRFFARPRPLSDV